MAFALSSSAMAQWADSISLVIHPATSMGEVQLAEAGEPLLRQKVTSQRAARLEDGAPSPKGQLGLGSNVPFNPGTPMFGVPSPDGWMYCAVADLKAFFEPLPTFGCFEDRDGDGDFDTMRSSGAPFGNIPLLIVRQGSTKALERPVRYTRTPYTEGPSVDIGLTWRPAKKIKEGDPPPTAIYVKLQLLSGPTRLDVTEERKVELSADRTAIVREGGAMISILGYTPGGELRYKVDKGLPMQLKPFSYRYVTQYY